MLQSLRKMTGPRKIISAITDRGLLVYIMLVALLIFAESIIPGFLRIGHMGSLLKMAAFTGIVAIGQTFVILIGGIDMSIANVVTLANIVAAQIMLGENSNILPALAAILAIGVVVGIANASGINFLKIPPMIMTLGIGIVLQGIMLLYSKGAPKGNAAPFIRSLVNETSIFGIFAPIVLIWLILGAISICVLKFTTFGRKIYVT
ncbi:MAG: ABC transporter permease, partial [Saccharofermentanales bacterium]